MASAVVLDCGSHTVKAGYSGENMPRIVFPNVIGRSKADSSCYIGVDALLRRHTTIISSPVRYGTINNWTDIEQVWRHAYSDDLKVNPEDHPVLLTESAEEAPRHREKKAEIFFEKLGVPQFSLATQSVLALYSGGLTSGVVVDIGDGQANVVPILEGRALHDFIIPLPRSGQDVTQRLLTSLRHYGFTETPTHRDIARHMKDNYCYVARSDSEEEPMAPVKYTLPDGTTIHPTSSQLDCSHDFFSGDDSVQSTVEEAISRVDVEIQPTLAANITLAGGTTQCPGFRDRLIRQLGPSYTVMPNKFTNARYSAWLGGSILSSLSNFQSLCITAEEYGEYGSGLVNRRCVMELGMDDFYGLYSFSGC